MNPFMVCIDLISPHVCCMLYWPMAVIFPLLQVKPEPHEAKIPPHVPLSMSSNANASNTATSSNATVKPEPSLDDVRTRKSHFLIIWPFFTATRSVLSSRAFSRYGKQRSPKRVPCRRRDEKVHRLPVGRRYFIFAWSSLERRAWNGEISQGLHG